MVHSMQPSTRSAGVVFVVVCVLAWLPALCAMQPYRPTIADPLEDRWRWQAIAELDGKGPMCMAEDGTGRVWFGLEKGIACYDGERWQNFGEADGVGTTVQEIRGARDGAVYAGTANGLVRFAGGRWQRVFPAQPDQTVSITTLEETSNGEIWAGSHGFLIRVADGAVTLFTAAVHADELAKRYPQARVVTVPGTSTLDGIVDALLQDRTGMMWCGTQGVGVVRFNPRAPDLAVPGAWMTFDGRGGFHPARAETALFEDSTGVVWVGSGDPDVGINMYDTRTGTWSYLKLSDVLGTDNIVRSITQTRDGSIWVGGLSRFFRYQDGTWRHYAAPNAPVSSARILLSESRRGFLWILAEGDGVQKVDYSGDRWLKYDGLNYECDGVDGRQWFVSGDDGVVSYDGAKWERYGPEDGLMQAPYTMIATRRGGVWAAGTHDGKAAVAYLDGNHWVRRTLETIQPKFGYIVDYRAMLESADGCLWLGTYVNGRPYSSHAGGLLQYDPRIGPLDDDRAWTNHVNYTVTQSSRFDYSNGIAQLPDGAVYSVCRGGVIRWWKGELTRLDVIPERMGIDSVCSSADGQLWLATRGMGVVRFDGQNVVRYETQDGLMANAVTSVFCDRNNRIWAATGRGVSYFDGSEWLTDVFADANVAVTFEGGGFKQSPNGAMWINQCSRNWLRRVMPGPKNEEIIASSFSTIRYIRATAAPKTVITTAVGEVSQPGNTVVAWRGEIPWWSTRPSDLRYSYRLDGGAWSKFAAETSHVFLQLGTGRHTFEVRARDRDLNVEKQPARIEFKVIPPIWKTPWFIALVAVFTAAVATQSARVMIRDRSLRRANVSLAIEIDEHKKTEAELGRKTGLLEDEVRQRAQIQAVLEEKKLALEQEIEERKRMEKKVERAQKELLQASREAGMAEVATNVLHNVGNALNSVNVSANVVIGQIANTRTAGLEKAAELLQQHAGEPDYLKSDPQGALIPNYLHSFVQHLGELKSRNLAELETLRKSVEHIAEIVAMQQNYARAPGVPEKVTVVEIADDALRLQANAFQEHGVEIVREYAYDGPILVEKHKLLQVLVNLIANADRACVASERTDKRVRVSIAEQTGRVRIEIADNGVGIPAENLVRIFNQGFSTWQDGHGMGLHGSANAAKELGGALGAQSAGVGRGATFTLELPLGPPAGKSRPAAAEVA